MLPPDIASRETLLYDVDALGVQPGDGLFVHASMGAIGHVVGGARIVVEALIRAVGPNGLLAMPAFSTDAIFPPDLDTPDHTLATVDAIEEAVPGHDPAHSPATGVGAIAEAFRTWQGTIRSSHPSASICLRGPGVEALAHPHPLPWAFGSDSPLGRLRQFPTMKILLIGVDWTGCSALHTAETLAVPRRTRRQHLKLIEGDKAHWAEFPDVADDNGRLFPGVGAAFEATGAVSRGRIGAAEARLFGYAPLVDFAASWIGAANAASGNRA